MKYKILIENKKNYTINCYKNIELQCPGLRWGVTCLDVVAESTENGKIICLPLKELYRPWVSGDHQTRYPCLHCQLLNVVWEWMDPSFTPSGHSSALHAPELLWVVSNILCNVFSSKGNSEVT